MPDLVRVPVLDFCIPCPDHRLDDSWRHMPGFEEKKSCGRGPSVVRTYLEQQGFRKTPVWPTGIEIHDRSISFAKQTFGVTRVPEAEENIHPGATRRYKTQAGWTESQKNRSVT